MILAFLLSCLLTTGLASCPHQRPGLKRWSDQSTWTSQNKPVEGDSIFITDSILLDESPPELYNITIETGGSLVADPDSKVTLRVANIYVDGAFEIGSEDCLFDGELTITMTGTRESHRGEKEPKVILVKSGGTLEIHGESKLPWTKISRTLKPYSSDQIYFEHKTSANADVDYWKRGLVMYTFTIDSNGIPSVKQFGAYRLVNDGIKFAEHINNVDDGDVLMMTTQRYIRLDDGNPKSQQSLAYDAVEKLLYGHVTNSGTLRSVPDDGTAYALIYQKGNAESMVEVRKPLGEGLSINFVWNEQLVFMAETGSGKNYYYQIDNFRVSSTDIEFPVIDVIDDTSSWKPGDRLVITSTDYEWNQAEERTVVECKSCSNRQLRVNAPFKYIHFGEMIKGDSIDMRAEVGLLSRNVIIEGEMEDSCPPGNENCDEIFVYGWDTFGAHVKVLAGYSSVHIEGVELRNVGQQTDLGRYPIHFHMCLDPPDADNLPYIREVSIHHTFARCVTIHGSHNVQLIDNVCYDHIGHGFFLEDGSEMGTLFDGNLAASTRRGTQFLEPLDSRPASFWITNPNTRVLNNVAAGGDGNGFWFIYPDEPMGPSKDLGIMALYEARSTPITEFFNNVAHSNLYRGIMIGSRLKPDRTLTCCNLWQPRENPKDPKSAQIETTLAKMTAYKNRRLNVWAEGGRVNFTQISVSDGADGIMIHNEGQGVDNFSGRLTKSVVVGISENHGVPEEGYDRSMPMPWDLKFPQAGISMWFGPVKVSEIWFDGFEQNDKYDTGAISLKRNTPYVTFVNTEFSDIRYAFNDGPGLSNLAITGTFGVNPGWPDDDGSLTMGFTWIRETETGVQKYYVVRPDHFSAAADDCKVRKNWRLAVCETKYGNLRIKMKNSEKNDGMVFVRDDLPSAQLTMKMDETIGPTVVLDGSRRYTMHFLGEISGEVRIIADGMEIGDVLTVGICLPLDASVRVASYRPSRLTSIDRFTRVDSLEELDLPSEELDGKKYFHDEKTGMFYYKFKNNKDRDPDERNSCADGECPNLFINVDSGTLTDADCRERLYGDKQNMPKPTLPTFNEVLPANAGLTPPEGWGAGFTKPFTSRDAVDGGFSDWTAWSECSASCSTGVESRQRKCNNPSPRNGGAGCDGPSTEERVCFVQESNIEGMYEEWSEWSSCQSVIQGSCSGFSTRQRECTNTELLHDCLYCTGSEQEVQSCSTC